MEVEVAGAHYGRSKRLARDKIEQAAHRQQRQCGHCTPTEVESCEGGARMRQMRRWGSGGRGRTGQPYCQGSQVSFQDGARVQVGTAGSRAGGKGECLLVSVGPVPPPRPKPPVFVPRQGSRRGLEDHTRGEDVERGKGRQGVEFGEKVQVGPCHSTPSRISLLGSLGT